MAKRKSVRGGTAEHSASTESSRGQVRQGVFMTDGEEWVERVPKAVQESADKFLDKKRKAATLTKERDDAEEDLIELCGAKGIAKIRVDNGEKDIIITSSRKAVIKKASDKN